MLTIAQQLKDHPELTANDIQGRKSMYGREYEEGDQLLYALVVEDGEPDGDIDTMIMTIKMFSDKEVNKFEKEYAPDSLSSTSESIKYRKKTSNIKIHS